MASKNIPITVAHGDGIGPEIDLTEAEHLYTFDGKNGFSE